MHWYFEKLGATGIIVPGTVILVVVIIVVGALHEQSHKRDCIEFSKEQLIRDGSLLQRGISIPQVWNVTNCGKTWDKYTLLRIYNQGFNKGDLDQESPYVDIPKVGSGKTVSLSVAVYAPKTPGDYTLLYQMRDPDGIHLFGEPLTIQFTVR